MPSRIYGLRNALRAFIKALWNTSFQNSASIRRAEATTLRRGEQLEPRWQCSATAQLIGSDFFVRGDNYGNTMNLALEQRNGRDYLVARDAFNTIISGTQAEASLVKRIQVLGGSGKDTIHLGTLDLKKLPNLREVHLYGSGGNDAITGSRGSDFIYAGDGDDVVNSGNGMTYQGFQPHDVIYGDAGNDDIFGNDGYYGKFTFYGGTGNDRMWGNYQDDLFYGDLGNDIMYPAGGNDILEGGLGDDQYYYSSGAMNKDMVLDIGGTDFLVISGFTKGMGVDLRKWGTDPSQSLTTDFDPATNDCIFLQVLQNSIENIVGTNYEDILIGKELSNYIQDEGWNYQLLGLGGSD
ncbi:MAG: calcium-binding protein, partial [Pirellulales bacterium]|nr:calcium-binding protein [Pirellulales bacterium]